MLSMVVLYLQRIYLSIELILVDINI
jgi:hypothetical protein